MLQEIKDIGLMPEKQLMQCLFWRLNYWKVLVERQEAGLYTCWIEKSGWSTTT